MPLHRLRRIETLYAARRWDEAQLLLEQSTSDLPSGVHVVGYLGLIAARKRDGVRADSLIQVLHVLQESDGDVLPAVYRARIAAVLGEREHAVQLLRQAINSGYGLYGQPFEQFPLWDFASLSGYGPYLELMEPKG